MKTNHLRDTIFQTKLIYARIPKDTTTFQCPTSLRSTHASICPPIMFTMPHPREVLPRLLMSNVDISASGLGRLFLDDLNGDLLLALEPALLNRLISPPGECCIC